MRKRKLAVVCLTLLVGFPLFASPTSIPAKLDSLILVGKKQLYNFDMSRAEHTFQRIRESYPSYPHGYFYQAYLTLIIYSQDMTNDSLATALQHQIQAALKVADDFARINPEEPDAYFHFGLCYGLEGINQVVQRNYIKGYLSGRKAKKHLEQVVKLDEDYFDAYLGLGIFHYYVDLLPGVLKLVAGILGFDGNRELGKKEIALTARQGHFFKEEANFVQQILRYFLEGDKNRPVKAFVQMHRNYPGNPAITLLLGYHYRRLGYIDQAYQYFSSVPDSFSVMLPQITNIKYYNLGVCNFLLNNFREAESYFDKLLKMPTRKSPFYQAAIAFYKGLIADMQFDRKKALFYYRKIFKNKHTKFWFYSCRMFVKYPVDSLMAQFITTENMLSSRKFQDGLQNALRLHQEVKSGKHSKNPNLPYLVEDLLGQIYYAMGKYDSANAYFQSVWNALDSFKDPFYRSWFFIHYARSLRAIEDFEQAGKMLEKAEDLDDDYTRIIIAREKFVLKQVQTDRAKKAEVLR